MTDLIQSGLIWLTSLVIPDEVLFTDGNSFTWDGFRYAGATGIIQNETIWAQSLSRGTSAQPAEFLALTQTFPTWRQTRLSPHTLITNMLLPWPIIHGDPYRARGLLTSARKESKNREETLALWEAILLPKRVSIANDTPKGSPQKPEAKKPLDCPATSLWSLSKPSLQMLPEYNLTRLTGQNEN